MSTASLELSIKGFTKYGTNLLAPDGKSVTISDASSCQCCLNFNLEQRERNDTSYVLRNIKELREAAESGCVYCAIIYGTKENYRLHVFDDQNKVSFYLNEKSSNSIAFNWHWFPTDHDSIRSILDDPEAVRRQLSLCPGAEPWGRFDKAEGIPASAKSTRSLNFCRKMLQDCLEFHPKCRCDQDQLPTRLLFLGDSSNSMKIVESSKIESCQYAALSHCRGTTRNLELNNENEALLKQSIRLNSLPQTYRDAVLVCEELKIKYLWIDSICIKQDDKEDWSHEAAKMAEVYENALVVIAASCCKSTEESFLNPRKPQNGGPVVVAWTNEKMSRPLLQVQKIPMNGIHALPYRGVRDPLETRAWCFQEKKLAHRLLSFTREEVQWSCKASISCECSEIWNRPFETPTFWPPFNPQSIPTTTEEWLDSLQEFCRLNLTFQSDKLPALSGLAARFQQKNKVDYIAGLWLNDVFTSQLAWYCHDTVESSSDNPFGEVLDGYLRIRGRAAVLMMYQPLSVAGQVWFRSENGEVSDVVFYADSHRRRNFFMQASRLRNRSVRPGRSLRWLEQATEDLPEFLPVLCLKICSNTDSELLMNFYLMLAKSIHVPGAYERIELAIKRRNKGPDNQDNLEIWDSAPVQELQIV